MSINSIIQRGAVPGDLYFGPVAKNMRERFGRNAYIAHLTMRAPGITVHDLHWAKALTAKEGGLMIEGTELRTKGSKSSPIKTRQTWWCMFDRERAYEAMLKMDVRSATGFHPNDDDMDTPDWR